MALGALGNAEALQARARAQPPWPPNSMTKGMNRTRTGTSTRPKLELQKASDTLFTSTVREMILAGDRNGSAVESLTHGGELLQTE